MIEFVPIEEDFSVQDIAEEPLKSTLDATLEYYKTIGFQKPWISYLAKRGQDYVGTCAFKGRPVNNRVEVAYFTFPAYEGKGFATAMCGELIQIARDEDAAVVITARTLPETNASTHVLQKNGFSCVGIVVDPEDGEVFEWLLNE